MSAGGEELFKVVVVGDSGVGKTSILLRTTENRFIEKQVSTIGYDSRLKRVEVDGQMQKLQLWDTCGQEKFATLASVFFRKAHGVFVVFDITKPETLESSERWIEASRQYAPDDVQVAMIANKVDMLDRPGAKSCRDQAKDFAARRNLKLFFISAKEGGDDVEAAFKDLVVDVLAAKRVRDEKARAVPEPAPVALQPAPQQEQAKKGCC